MVHRDRVCNNEVIPITNRETDMAKYENALNVADWQVRTRSELSVIHAIQEQPEIVDEEVVKIYYATSKTEGAAPFIVVPQTLPITGKGLDDGMRLTPFETIQLMLMLVGTYNQSRRKLKDAIRKRMDSTLNEE